MQGLLQACLQTGRWSEDPPGGVALGYENGLPARLGDVLEAYRARGQSDGDERLDGRGVLRILPAQDIAGTHGKTYLFVGYDEIHGYWSWDLLEALARTQRGRTRCKGSRRTRPFSMPLGRGCLI